MYWFLDGRMGTGEHVSINKTSYSCSEALVSYMVASIASIAAHRVSLPRFTCRKKHNWDQSRSWYKIASPMKIYGCNAVGLADIGEGS